MFFPEDGFDSIIVVRNNFDCLKTMRHLQRTFSFFLCLFEMCSFNWFHQWKHFNICFFNVCDYGMPRLIFNQILWIKCDLKYVKKLKEEREKCGNRKVGMCFSFYTNCIHGSFQICVYFFFSSCSCIPACVRTKHKQKNLGSQNLNCLKLCSE